MINRGSDNNLVLQGMQLQCIPPPSVPCNTCNDITSLELYPAPGKLEISAFINTKPSRIQFIERKNPQQLTDSISGVFVIVLFAMLVLAKVSYPRRFKQFLLAALTNNGLNLLLREWNPRRNVLSYLFGFVYFSGITLLIHETVDYFGGSIQITGNQWQDFALSFLAIVFVFSGKYQTITWLSVVFNVRSSGIRYLSNHVVFSLISGLALIPILLSVIYNPSEITLFSAVIIIALIQLFRLIRSIAVGMSERGFNLFYLFLYLCTLEILPVLILFKAVTTLASGSSFN